MYGNWEVTSALLYIAGFVTLTASGWLLASYLADHLASRTNNSQFVLTPYGYYWAIVSAIPSYFLSEYIVDQYLRYKLGVFGFQEFRDYKNMSHGYDAFKAKRILQYILIPPALAAILLGISNRLVITATDIHINHFWSLGEQQYSIAQIEQLALVRSRQAPNGNIVRRASYAFLLQGEPEYDFDETLLDASLKEQKAIIDYLSERTNRPIQIKDPYPPRQSK
jgi:hypothetical protein